MKPTRKLRLNRESLHELTNDDLALVVGGADVSLTHCDPNCVTYTFTRGCPSDNTDCPSDYCTDTCTFRTLCDRTV